MDNLSSVVERKDPVVTKYGILDMQVCVPKDWTDEQVLEFAQKEYPCGTENGWQVRKSGNKLLNGEPERVECNGRNGFVHVMLDA
jgi:hypothetical protein